LIKHGQSSNAGIVLPDTGIVEEHGSKKVASRIFTRTHPTMRGADHDLMRVTFVHVRNGVHNNDISCSALFDDSLIIASLLPLAQLRWSARLPTNRHKNTCLRSLPTLEGALGLVQDPKVEPLLLFRVAPSAFRSCLLPPRYGVFQKCLCGVFGEIWRDMMRRFSVLTPALLPSKVSARLSPSGPLPTAPRKPVLCPPGTLNTRHGRTRKWKSRPVCLRPGANIQIDTRCEGCVLLCRGTDRNSAEQNAPLSPHETIRGVRVSPSRPRRDGGVSSGAIGEAAQPFVWRHQQSEAGVYGDKQQGVRDRPRAALSRMG